MTERDALPPARRPAITREVYRGPQDGASSPSAHPVARGLSYDVDPRHHGLPGAARRRREYREAGDLTAELLGELTGLVQGVHTAISGRVFRYVGPHAAPVRLVHSAVATGVYGAVKLGGTGLARAAGHLLAHRDIPPPSATTTGNVVLGAVNGILGAELVERDSPLAVRMDLRADGRSASPTRAGLAAAYPDARRRVVVFAHGLCETEDAWRLGAAEHYGDPASTHGSRLERDLGYTPVYLRYNTGRHISDNGRQLDDLLERLVQAWPVPLEELALVGHSMGGLLMRSACHVSASSGTTWTAKVRHMIYLGAPHFGAPLAQLVHVGSWGMARLPETAPVARLLNRRSAGVRDLRHGSIAEADWKDLDPDALRARRPSDVPLMPRASHYYIGATLTRDRAHPLGRVLGDALVQFPSASGRTRRRRLEFEADNGKHLGGLHHFDLLNHPLVYEHVRTWLSVPAEDVEAAVDAVEQLTETEGS